MLKNVKKTTRSVIAAALLLMLPTAHQVMASDFLLFYANDVQGETEPCG